MIVPAAHPVAGTDPETNFPLLGEGGVEARLAAADVGAEAEAEADRRELLEAKGDDANASETKVELIRKRFGDEDPPID